jgi:hypothetical protein
MRCFSGITSTDYGNSGHKLWLAVEDIIIIFGRWLVTQICMSGAHNNRIQYAQQVIDFGQNDTILSSERHQELSVCLQWTVLKCLYAYLTLLLFKSHSVLN